jgi:uncharacterized protein YcbX
MTAALAAIRRYPVKGLAGQDLPFADLEPGRGLAQDRRWAIAHAAGEFDPAAPGWLPKRHFVQLLTEERLALLGIDYGDAPPVLQLLREGRRVARGDLSQPIGRELINQFLAAFLKDGRGTPKIVEAPGVAFTDTPDPFVSIINLATVRDIERVARAPVDPARFRGNLMIDGVPAWAEFGWIGRTVSIGDAALEVAERIGRCAATNVDPMTAERNLNIPKLLIQGFGHADCGIYLRVRQAGRIAAGDALQLI